MLNKFDRIHRNGIEEIHVSFVDGETREFKDLIQKRLCIFCRLAYQ